MVNDTFIIDDQVFKILSKNVGTDGITYELESCDAPVLCTKCHSDNFIGHGRRKGVSVTLTKPISAWGLLSMDADTDVRIVVIRGRKAILS